MGVFIYIYSSGYQEYRPWFVHVEIEEGELYLGLVPHS